MDHHCTPDQLIASINAHHLTHLRQVRGRDINDHHTHIHQLQHQGDHPALLDLLGEIIPLTYTLQQYDPREPDPYWTQMAVDTHTYLGDHTAARELWSAWLTHWPTHREIPTYHRGVIEQARHAALTALSTHDVHQSRKDSTVPAEHRPHPGHW